MLTEKKIYCLNLPGFFLDDRGKLKFSAREIFAEKSLIIYKDKD